MAKKILFVHGTGVRKDGYEASFIALQGNPIEDFSNIRKIKFRYKQGNFIKTRSK